MQTVVHRFDLASETFKRDPFPTFARMRDAGPIVRAKLPFVGEAWLATRYDSVTTILKNNRDFVQEPRNAGRRQLPGLKWWMPRSLRAFTDNMLLKDEPDHRRLRGLVDQAFHRQQVEQLRERIAVLTDKLLDNLSEQRQIDLLESFARPLPLMVISELLGLPESERARFMSWVKRLMSASSQLGIFLAMPSLVRLPAFFRRQFEDCRRRPRPGLISALIEAEQAGDRLSESELLSMVFLLLVAGHETTVHLISGGTLALLQNPDQKARLTADWSKVNLAVEELLRFVTPVQLTKVRHARRDMQLYDREVRRGDYFMAVLASANAYPAQFEAPDRLDLTRQPNNHLAFGTGVHFCLGLQLARAEAQIAIERLFRRYPDLRLAVPDEEIRWTGKLGLRAVAELPVRL